MTIPDASGWLTVMAVIAVIIGMEMIVVLALLIGVLVRRLR